MRILCLALFVCWTMSAQSVNGTVRDSATKLPVARLTVSVGNSSVLTDDQGHFAFASVLPGTLEISTKRERGYLSGSQSLTIGAGKDPTAIELLVDKAAVVAGRVVDQNEEPVVGAMVMVRSQGFRNGRPALTSFHSGRTDDRGEFRVANLQPGRYLVEVELKDLEWQKVDPDVAMKERGPVKRNVRTYYANSPSLAGAAQITLRAGQVMEGFEIGLARTDTFCVQASIAANGSPKAVGMFLSESFPGSQSRVARGSVIPGEVAEVCGVPAGSYRLWSMGASGGEFAGSVFQVSDKEVRLPPLHLSSPAPVFGHVTVADAKPEDPFPTGVRVGLETKDRIGMQGESTYSEALKSGDFIIPAAFPDEYWLNVSGVPKGFYVKQASIGDRDARRDHVIVGSGELRVVLGSDGPSLSGQVVDKDGQQVPSASVVLALASFPVKIATNELLTTVSDVNGQFSLNGMAPGQYRIFAMTGLGFGEAGDPALVNANRNSAIEVELAARESKVVKLTALRRSPGAQ